MTPDHVIDGDIYFLRLEELSEFFLWLFDEVLKERENLGVNLLDYTAGIERAWIELEEFIIEGKLNQ